MTDLTWVPQIRQAHLALVVLSGTLFALRGAGVLAGADHVVKPDDVRVSQTLQSCSR